MRMDYEPTPASDLEMLVENLAHGGGTTTGVHELASERLADFVADRLSRITMPITEHYDWDRLRVNVAHKVEPKLVKWSK